MRSPAPQRARLAGKVRAAPHYAPGEDRDRLRFRVPPSLGRPKRMFLTCHYCGYDPPDDLPGDGICPKCHGSSWERFTLAEPLVPQHMK